MGSGFRRLALCAALALGSAAAPGSAAFAQVATFAPVAAVNDKVITRYDVEQRARIMAAASEEGGIPAQMLDQALEALIMDQIKIQAATAADLAPDDGALAAGLEEIARQNGMGADGMFAFFQSRGVSRQALQDQIRAEVAWRNLLRGRYAARIEPSERDVDAALAANPGANRDAVKARLIDQRAGEVSRAVMQELRAKAVIEQR